MSTIPFLSATSDKCPHAGGPIHLGDIEMMPDKSLCVRCPWHRWAFRLGADDGGAAAAVGCRPRGGGEARNNREAGECVFPPTRKDKRLQVFPAKVGKDRRRVEIGFDKFDTKTLCEEEY